MSFLQLRVLIWGALRRAGRGAGGTSHDRMELEQALFHV